MSSDAGGAVMAAVVVGIVTLVGIAVLGSLGGVAIDIGISDGTTEINPTTDEPATLDENIDEQPTFFDVQATQGHGIELAGEGYIATDPPADWENGSWSVCAVGQLDDVNEQATYNLVALDDETLRLDWGDGAWKAYYNSSDGSGSALVEVPAERPAELTPACVVYNETAGEVGLYADGNESSAALDGEIESRAVAHNWVGTVDEKRLFDGALDADARERFVAAPTAGIGVEDSARYMFEEGSGSETDAFYHNDTATIVAGSWTVGVGNPDLAAGSDYETGIDPLTITTLSDGQLDESPVLYVAWDSGVSGSLRAVLSGTASALALVPIVLLLLIVSAIMITIGRLRGRSR